MDLSKLSAMGSDTEKTILNFNNKTPGQRTPVRVLVPKEKNLFKILKH